jgi:hypothetical protein
MFEMVKHLHSHHSTSSIVGSAPALRVKMDNLKDSITGLFHKRKGITIRCHLKQFVVLGKNEKPCGRTDHPRVLTKSLSD